jgi:hypothetical protein
MLDVLIDAGTEAEMSKAATPSILTQEEKRCAAYRQMIVVESDEFHCFLPLSLSRTYSLGSSLCR